MASYGKDSTAMEAKRNASETLKISLKAFGIHPDTREQLAEDWAKWRSFFHKGCTTC